MDGIAKQRPSQVDLRSRITQQPLHFGDTRGGRVDFADYATFQKRHARKQRVAPCRLSQRQQTRMTIPADRPALGTGALPQARRAVFFDSLSATTLPQSQGSLYREFRVSLARAKDDMRSLPERVQEGMTMFRFGVTTAVLCLAVVMSGLLWKFSSVKTAVYTLEDDAEVSAFAVPVLSRQTEVVLYDEAERFREAQAAARAEEQERQAAIPPKDPAQVAFEAKATELVAGYPIAEMLPEIFKQDREVAKFLIAIAKQESQWGKRVPVLGGQDCYNYWGYRLKRARMGTGGHTCFDSPAEAVTIVGERIHKLVYEYDRTTAKKLIVWKCGYSCDGHSQYSVDSWINTVELYHRALARR